jgi:hypothetical protein
MKNQISASTIANLPIDEAWVKLSDLGKAHYYVPDLTASEITTEKITGIGASRIVRSSRPPMIETVVEWNEGEGLLLWLHHDQGDGIPPLLSQATFRYSLTKESATTTRLTNTLSYDMKWGIIGNLFGSLARKPMLKMQKQVTYGQRLYYETGEKVELEQINNLIRSERRLK